MWSYQAPLTDIRFVIEQWLDAPTDWQRLPTFAELDMDTTQQVLDEAARFATDVLLPINSPGDLQGCHWHDGAVTTPEGYRAAYQAYVAGGWPALACDPKFGGQGLPQLLNTALYEMLVSCCHAWAMYPGLAHGAYECIRQHGSASLQQSYLPKLVSGEWLATMCLTEAHAGSDVGLLRTRAESIDSERYAITGNKIFISGGEHDLTDNIVHLVLARLPDAPAGTRGISLFLVPKFLQDGRRNGVHCDAIEKKMGIKGSATCALRFEQAQGFLVGEANKGLQAMFVMMNAARLHVGLQGLSHAQIAHQNALDYARERRQMRAVKPAAVNETGAAADCIIEHPAMRRILFEQRVHVQSSRMLAYWAAHLLDMSEHHPDAEQRQQAHQWVSLLTPVIKAMLTENGFALANSALQVYGGHGYIHDNGIEQCVRDSRIAVLYEGTTEIQAIDLVVRKIMGDRALTLTQLLSFMAKDVEQLATDASVSALLDAFLQSMQQLHESTQWLLSNAESDRERVLRGAVDYLWQFGVVLQAYALLKAVRVSLGSAQSAQRLQDAQFFIDFVLPNAAHRQQLLRAACHELPRFN